ncbi:hypothetical protein ONZ45_g136 [Pleurotus djamor]|nr:hypothetical protein ONZ45_g136 [Pleurotus djamor]
MAEKDATVRLRRAVKENNLFLVKRLVQRTDMRNPDPSTRRYTSLAWAAVLGHEETFEYLLSVGHDDEELSRDSENNTILMLLADYRPQSFVTYIGRPPNSEDLLGAALRMSRLYYDRYPTILDWSNAQGKTALHIAALKGNEELVRMLCDLGADFDLADNKGNTSLHYASSWGHIPIVQLLIERGCQFAARNNEGFTASDYAYSFSTRDTLQDTARMQYENNKKMRRAVFAQAAAKGHEWGGTPVTTALPLPPRMRSGSGTSRTTATSDSADMDVLGSLPTHSQPSISSSPPRPSMSSFFHSSRSHTHSPNLSSASSASTFSALAPNPPSINASTLASALSPVATKMRERDASAMERYMRRNRSGSQGTSSDNRSQNGSVAQVEDSVPTPLPITGSVTPRRLRPSMSAAQLRPTPETPLKSSDALQPELRNRSGTSPTTTRPSISSIPILTRSSSTSQSPHPLTHLTSNGNIIDEPDRYTGPPSQYARFPEPPPAETDSNTTTPTRRLGFHHLLNKPHPSDPPNPSIHRRGLSATAVRNG